MPDQKNVVIGVCGGIAAYKALDVVSTLKKNNIDVHVIMTKSAGEFVKPLSFQALSQNPVIMDMFEEPKSWEIQHIALAKAADLILIVPATANIIGKVASGIADDMLSTTIMATKAPIIFAPAMNSNMYSNQIVKNNIILLKEFGYKFIEPASGRLACGDVGEGKLEDTKIISEMVLSTLYPIKDMVGQKILVTAGPTMAPIDPVRFITNRSTGKMGYAVACEARDRGADVTLISGSTSLQDPYGVRTIKVSTNEEMLNSVLHEFGNNDIVIKAAAVSDFKPRQYSSKKIKKTSDELTLELVKDNYILKQLGKIKNKQILVGFAAESDELISNAEAKLKNKNLDYIVANDITAVNTGFASDCNKVTVLCKDGKHIELDKMTKKEVARELFNVINKKR